MHAIGHGGKARQRVLLIGWDFDTRIHLTHGQALVAEAVYRRKELSHRRLGSFILWLVRRNSDELEDAHPEMGPTASCHASLSRGSMMTGSVSGGSPHRSGSISNSIPPIPWVAAHHQKIVVIDDRFGGVWRHRYDRLAGGTRASIARTDPRRKQATMASCHTGPWHDADDDGGGGRDCQLSGQDLSRDRWIRAGGQAS